MASTLTKRYLPLVGVGISVVLFVLAASRYPGGTLESADSVGYDWRRHFISTLFGARALNGAPNPSRNIAIPAMLALCVSAGVLLKRISTMSDSRRVAKSIEIGGIGTMVYTFLAVTTRMHDLLVTIGVGFFAVAALATLLMFYSARHMTLLVAGAMCLALFVASCVIHYGNVLYGFLAVAQKVTFVACIAWLLAISFADLDPKVQQLRTPEPVSEG